jgi:tetratricopeptide (TPR) repeat protein
MTIDEARRILGLEPGDDAAMHLDEFEAARERIAEMVRAAPNDALALRYQEGLDQFDAALAAMRARLGRPPVVEPGVTGGVVRVSGPRVRPGGGARRVAVALALVVVGCGGLWLFFRIREDMELQRRSRLVFLERQGSILVENRRWSEAAAVYQEIEQIEPGSVIAGFGRRSIEAGIGEEQKQFIGYWSGEAQAAIESGRWEDAGRAIGTLAAKVPDSDEIAILRERIDDGRRAEARKRTVEEARAALAAGRWPRVKELTDKLLAGTPDDAEVAALRSEAETRSERERGDLARARELLGNARRRDTGVFDEQALEWLREARRLAPGDREIAALYDKLAGYTRTLTVPGDFGSIAAAIEAARPRDRIRIGAGTWNEALQVDKPLELEGAGRDQTVIECGAGDGPVIVWGSAAGGGRASRMLLRHRTVAPGAERFSVVLVRGGQVGFGECEMRDGNGHGVVVIEGGLAVLNRCRFAANGWDGVAAYGDGSRVEVSECESTGNYEHGIDIWNGAAAVIRGSTASGNGRNGSYIATPGPLEIIDSRFIDNREFGLVVAASRGGTLHGNTAERNRLGGIAIHRTAAELEVRDNRALRNEGPGLVLDRGFAARVLANNLSEHNATTRQIVDDVELDAAGGADAPPAE